MDDIPGVFRLDDYEFRSDSLYAACLSITQHFF